MAFPDTHDNPSVPAPSTIRASGSGISPAGTVAELIAAIRNLEFKLGLSARVTFTADAGTDTFTSTAHSLQNGDVLTVLSSGGALPNGLLINTAYYVINITTNTFQLSTSYGGSAINITDAGTGTLQFAKMLGVGKFLIGSTNGQAEYGTSVPDLTVTNLLTVLSLIVTNALVLPQSASIAPTTEGSLGWDTDNDLLKVGTGLSTKTIVDEDTPQTLVDKTLRQPFIDHYGNAVHDHEDNTGGGQLTIAALRDRAVVQAQTAINEAQASTISLSGGTFQDMTGFSGNFTSEGGDLLLFAEWTYYKGTTGTRSYFRYVLDAGTPNEKFIPSSAGFFQYTNEIASHKMIARTLIAENILPGAHTIKMQGHPNSAGTLQTDAEDVMRLTILELKRNKFAYAATFAMFEVQQQIPVINHWRRRRYEGRRSAPHLFYVRV